MDYASLANDALVAATPYLQDLGKEVVDVGAKSAGKAVIDWIKARLTGEAGRKAVEAVEKAPQAAGPRMVLQGQLLTLLEENRDAADSLAKLLSAVGPVAQTANAIGPNATAFNANNSTVSLHRP